MIEDLTKSCADLKRVGREDPVPRQAARQR